MGTVLVRAKVPLAPSKSCLGAEIAFSFPGPSRGGGRSCPPTPWQGRRVLGRRWHTAPPACAGTPTSQGTPCIWLGVAPPFGAPCVPGRLLHPDSLGYPVHPAGCCTHTARCTLSGAPQALAGQSTLTSWGVPSLLLHLHSSQHPMHPAGYCTPDGSEHPNPVLSLHPIWGHPPPPGLTLTMASLVCAMSEMTPSVMISSTKYWDPSSTAAAELGDTL